MAYVNGTTHYNLPQTVGTDKRDWADTNQAFADIDAAIYGAVDDVAQAEIDISDLKSRMSTAEGNIVTNTGDISALDTRLTTAEGAITSQAAQITDTRQDLEDMICAYNEATATSTHAYEIGDYFIYNDVLYRATQAIAIGDTIVPDTNCTTTNVTTELLNIDDLSGDVTQLQSDVGQLQTDVGAAQTDIDQLEYREKIHTLGVVNHTSNATNSEAIADVYSYIQANYTPDQYNHIMFEFWDSKAPFTFGGVTDQNKTRFSASYITTTAPVITNAYLESSEIYMWNGGAVTDIGSQPHVATTTTVLYV